MNPQGPGAGESDKLRQACCYMIFHATFLHTWANDLQLTDLGNVSHASLGCATDPWALKATPPSCRHPWSLSSS